MSWKNVVVNLRRDRYLYLMLLPFLVWYVIFQYKPLYGLQIAFMNYSPFKGMGGSPWIGFENFRVFFEGPYFFRTLRNTILISLYSLVIAFPIPILLALMLNEVKRSGFKRAIQTVTYLPHFISVVVIAGIVTNFLAPSNGLVNIWLDRLGFEKIYFLVHPEYFRSIYISMNVWKDAGFNAILYLAVLASINPELYESAVIDGAGKLKQIWHVTLPGILPTIMILLILRIGDFLEVGYEAIILLYQPATYETADVINTYVYRSGLQEGRYGLAAAVGLFNSTVGFVLVILANKLSNKFTGGGLW